MRHSYLLPSILLLAVSTSIGGQSPGQRQARYLDQERSRRVAHYRKISTAKLSGTAQYRCRIVPEQNRIEIRYHVQIEEPGNLVLVIPAWNPGSYTIRNYGKQIMELKLGSRALERVQPGVWIARKIPSGPLELSYSVPAKNFAERSFRRRPRGADGKPKPRSQGAYSYQINGAKLLVHEFSHVHLPCEIEFEVPKSWDIATGMCGAAGTLHGYIEPGRWHFVARDYDILIDCPLKLGLFESFSFKLRGVPFEVAIAGASPSWGDRQAFARRLRRISNYYVELFGGLPFDRYVYLCTIPGGGGLEHLNSTTVGLISSAGSRPGRMNPGDSLIAHEFFHAWNVKRLRPVALGPFDYTGPNRSSALWFCEGVTSYYAALGLVRTQLIKPDDYWRHIARRYSSLRNQAVRRRISVADSSWKVWDGRYWGARDRIDYYLKGECLGLLLDIELRHASSNRYSFDDVLRRLYAQVQRQQHGYAEEDIRRSFEHFAGRSFEGFFGRYVYGTDDLPVIETLRRAGLDATWSKPNGRSRLTISLRPGASSLARRIRHGLMTGTTNAEQIPH
ncbi:MAG: hypothetical protein CSA62_13200 [Planctomycetota bacterium]|nr:MAG: hypothetical protein CSA62_13200 [Planctomycetota bacterium]